MKGISRIDQVSKRTHGWYARVDFLGQKYSKFFADKKNGGVKQALLCATARWHNLHVKLGKPISSRKQFTVARTATGVVGVRHDVPRNRYEVTWTMPNSKQRKTSVSIRKHGIRKAFRMACAIRERMVAQ